MQGVTDGNHLRHDKSGVPSLKLPLGIGTYIVGNSFRMELETVLTNCPECAKSDCKSCGEELKTVLTNW